MTDEPATLFAELSASIGPLAHLPNNGAAYHTGEQVITALNRVLGPGKWSFHVLDSEFEPDSDECWVFGQITALIGGVTVVKQDYGSQAVKRARSTGKFVSKGEDRKAAATDALKRCARLFGVGLDAWANEKAPSWRPGDTDEPAPPPPSDGPLAGLTTEELAAKLQAGIAAARELKVAAPDVDIEALPRPELERLIMRLAAGVKAARDRQLATATAT